MYTMRIMLVLLLVTTAVPMWAVQLRVQGAVTDVHHRKALPGVLVRVYKDGVKQHVEHTGPSGRYSALLENNTSYVIRFSLPGHITKCFAVETYGPAWEKDSRVVDLEVEMTLFNSIEGLDLSFFDLPLGIARFTPMTGTLAWNISYEERIKPEVDRLMAELRMRREQLAIRDDQQRVADIIQR